MIDALHPALESLEDSGEELWQRPGQALAKAAEAGKSDDDYHQVGQLVYADHQNQHGYITKIKMMIILLQERQEQLRRRQ